MCFSMFFSSFTSDHPRAKKTPLAGVEWPSRGSVEERPELPWAKDGLNVPWLDRICLEHQKPTFLSVLKKDLGFSGSIGTSAHVPKMFLYAKSLFP